MNTEQENGAGIETLVGRETGDFYTTTNHDEASWLCDEWGQPLAGKLAAATNDVMALRTLCDKLAIWTFRRTPLLHEGVTAYRAGKASRRKAINHRRARENAAAQEKWRRGKPLPLKERLKVLRDVELLKPMRATPASLDRDQGDDPADPITLADTLTAGDFPDGLHTDSGPRQASGWGTVVVPPPDSEREWGTAINPHPIYRSELDDTHIAIRAVWRLFTWGYWGLLERIGIRPDAKVAVETDTGPEEWRLDDALQSAWYIATTWDTHLGWGADWMVEMLCPFLEGAAARLLVLYRQQTRHPFAMAA